MTFQIFGWAHLTGFKTWDSPEHPAFTYGDSHTEQFIGIGHDEHDGQDLYPYVIGRRKLP